MGASEASFALEHRAEKWEPVFRKKRYDNKQLERATCVKFNAARSSLWKTRPMLRWPTPGPSRLREGRTMSPSHPIKPLSPYPRSPRQTINRRPTRSAQPHQHPAMPLTNASQCNDRHRRPVRQRRESQPSQYPSPRMRTRGKQRRQEDDPRPRALGHLQLALIVNRHAAKHGPRNPPGVTPMPTISTPGRCLPHRPRQNQHQPPPPSDLRHPVEQRPPFTRLRAIMPEQYAPPPSRKPRGTRQQHCGRNTLIRHQPDEGHIFAVAGSHRPRL